MAGAGQSAKIVRARARALRILRTVAAGARPGTIRSGALRAATACMAFPLNITFRDMEPTPAVDRFVQRWAGRLEQANPRIERCDVVIERPHQHQHQGQRFHVRVSLAVPGPDVVVSRDHALDGAHEDLYVALRDAFRAARRQLKDHRARLRQQDVKTSALPGQGRVTYLDAEGEWGYLDADGRQNLLPPQQRAGCHAARGGRRGPLHRGARRQGTSGEHRGAHRRARPPSAPPLVIAAVLEAVLK